ncbi:MAG: tRNA (guanosine(37)-N1)-methyltransferase TrmD [Pirellulaceae bacterium]|nr:tRNA (guanosine(37)-N1)-methyltransferase TrmD [Pirellulaceae bacterium]
MRFDIITLFPDIFAGFLSESLLSKAIEAGLVEVHLHDLRAWSKNKHHKIDDRPYGGGPGMLIQVEPVVECVESVRPLCSDPGQLILLSPTGQRLNQALAGELTATGRLILLCGRYEGFDQRILDILQPRELSLGDFILNGGEVAAMAVIETTIRLIPGVLGDERSHQEDSHSTQGWLEFPQYTRPREFRGLTVPEVLLNGNHREIAAWRADQSRRRSAPP